MPNPLLRLIRVAALVTVALAVACSGDDAPPADASPSTTAVATAAATATATSTSAPTAAPTATPGEAEVVASTASIPTAELGIIEFTRADGVVFALPVEAPSAREFSIGLSGRRTLGEPGVPRGMLFRYSEERQGAFWMKNTHIDLAIAFVSTEGVIVDIREMVAESLDLVTPSARYIDAVEAPSGWYAERGIDVGATMRLLFSLPAD
ncbi:MAG TPA: DUF192 domain-containing protein [Dehalococcoidia bacterium]|nr:DUF192 domain-containing protein [Dehalococcoidia bacterium]